MNINIKERDRENTEKKILEAIGMMIAEKGFENIGINAIAARSGVSKVLIYRYFGSVEGLMAAYIRKNDFLLNYRIEIPSVQELPNFIKNIFHQHIEQLRSNPTLKRLYRWELSCNNEMIIQLREQREKIGLKIIDKISELTGFPQKEIAVLASMISASITYLVMLEEFCPVYNGIQLNKDSGWQQINNSIDTLIDKLFQN